MTQWYVDYFNRLLHQRVKLVMTAEAFILQRLCYRALVIEASEKFDYEFVVYDELEKFRQYNAEQFAYPYETRKTRVSSSRFELTNATAAYSFTQL